MSGLYIIKAIIRLKSRSWSSLFSRDDAAVGSYCIPEGLFLSSWYSSSVKWLFVILSLSPLAAAGVCASNSKIRLLSSDSSFMFLSVITPLIEYLDCLMILSLSKRCYGDLWNWLYVLSVWFMSCSIFSIMSLLSPLFVVLTCFFMLFTIYSPSLKWILYSFLVSSSLFEIENGQSFWRNFGGIPLLQRLSKSDPFEWDEPKECLLSGSESKSIAYGEN